MRVIQLQYPDETPVSKIIDDLTVLSRNVGQRGHRAAAAFDDAALPGVRSKLIQRSVPLKAVVTNQSTVTDGQPIAITGGSVTFTVVDGVITGGAFTPA